jgi:hypothetical protein
VSYTNCLGVPDFSKTPLATGAAAWEIAGSEVKYFNFFQNANCTGIKRWKYKDSTCFAKENWYKDPFNTFGSAANDKDYPDTGCLFIYEDSCFGTARTRICASIPDLQKSGLSKIGSINMADSEFALNWKGTVIGVVFFEKINFEGRAFGMKAQKVFNIESVEGLADAIAKAKSIALITKQ